MSLKGVHTFGANNRCRLCGAFEKHTHCTVCASLDDVEYCDTCGEWLCVHCRNNPAIRAKYAFKKHILGERTPYSEYL